MENQQKIIPYGRLESMSIDIEGMRSHMDFNVIEIMDENNPYPALLGLDWAFENLSLINLKKR